MLRVDKRASDTTTMYTIFEKAKQVEHTEKALLIRSQEGFNGGEPRRFQTRILDDDDDDNDDIRS